MERKEAVEVIKKNWPDSSFTMLREALETLIPELAESEDEKIRKRIIHALHGDVLEMGEIKKAIAWLEKQGEQKLIVPKFRVGDVVVNIFTHDQRRITSIKYDSYITDNVGFMDFFEQDDWELVEQKSAEWNKNDEVLLDDTLHFIREFQQSDRCIDEGDMQNSVTCENWLKFLKERYTWKPSDVQMEALVSAIDVMIDNRGAGDKNTILLSGLYHELKAL